jgi:hypothetical protein
MGADGGRLVRFKRVNHQCTLLMRGVSETAFEMPVEHPK